MQNSQLHTDISLISTQSEEITLSQAIYKTVPIIKLPKEMKVQGYNIGTVLPTVLCKLFENSSRDLPPNRATPIKTRKKIFT